MTTTDDQKPMDTTEADSSAGVSCAAAAGSALPRYYFSSAGYIRDSQSTRLGKLQDKERWGDYGAVICEELNARPDNAAAIIEAWQTHLEPNAERSNRE